MKQTIQVNESGTIDLILNDQQQLVMQFNCECKDALPYCKAVCCRHRPYYNIALEPGEEGKFDKTIPNPMDSTIQLLGHSGSNCAYLNQSCQCSVHSDKPKICQKWHCSPGGKGEGIEIRDDGWILLPAKGDAQHTEMYLDETQNNS